MVQRLHFSTLAAAGCMLLLVTYSSPAHGQGFSLSSVPGTQTAAGILASSSDGLSRYLAPDGPIQPGITAIGTLPVRGAELANNGITRISSGFGSGARSLANAANRADTSMPGLQALESAMPASFAQLGSMMQGAISKKNSFIRGQAEAGIEAGNRLGSMMKNGLQGMSVRSSGLMTDAFGSMQDTMMKGSSKLQGQMKQSMDGHMSRMQSMHGMGGQMMNQAQQLGQTFTEGLTGTMEHLQRTGQKMVGQIHQSHQKNTEAMGGILGSMHESVGNLGKNMGGNFGDVVGHAQEAAQKVSAHLQKAASAPMEALQHLGNTFGSMMQSASSGGKSAGGKY